MGSAIEKSAHKFRGTIYSCVPDALFTSWLFSMHRFANYNDQIRRKLVVIGDAGAGSYYLEQDADALIDSYDYPR